MLNSTAFVTACPSLHLHRQPAPFASQPTCSLEFYWNPITLISQRSLQIFFLTSPDLPSWNSLLPRLILILFLPFLSAIHVLLLFSVDAVLRLVLVLRNLVNTSWDEIAFRAKVFSRWKLKVLSVLFDLAYTTSLSSRSKYFSQILVFL